MDQSRMPFDWNQARAFLATAEAGSFSAAARALRQTQPTLSRQVAQLEHRLGVRLFERMGRKLHLTDAGREMLVHFRAMGEAALEVSLAASGRSEAVTGSVSITATDAMAAFQLPKVVERVFEVAPGLGVELVVSNDLRDLRRREADIALRHVQPAEPDLVARQIGVTSARFYASRAYLDRVGRPRSLRELAALDFMGLPPIERFQAFLSARGLDIDLSRFRLVVDNGIALGEMVRAGLGVTMLTADMAERFGELEIVLPDFEPVSVPLWLTTHRELYPSRRVRLVFSILEETLVGEGPSSRHGSGP
ncbi:LysR family transcriptional regulator [Nitratireductor sp. CH_MIT9313-5]|jgi:DNA-binding transcriptional LysR family regulator|uniref:LysR family transcriptional regulator n=1 Tax=Nitratireductor sp. CH_MIT9313-5 TaxID=3107764 RepID=UPI00300B691A